MRDFLVGRGVAVEIVEALEEESAVERVVRLEEDVVALVELFEELSLVRGALLVWYALGVEAAACPQ